MLGRRQLENPLLDPCTVHHSLPQEEPSVLEPDSSMSGATPKQRRQWSRGNWRHHASGWNRFRLRLAGVSTVHLEKPLFKSCSGVESSWRHVACTVPRPTKVRISTQDEGCLT